MLDWLVELFTRKEFYVLDFAGLLGFGAVFWQMYNQKEETEKLRKLTIQTANATLLQSEIDFCKKIEDEFVEYFLTFPSLFNEININDDFSQIKIMILRGFLKLDSKNSNKKDGKYLISFIYKNETMHTSSILTVDFLKEDLIDCLRIFKKLKNHLNNSRGGDGKASPLWSYYFNEDSPFQIFAKKCEDLIGDDIKIKDLY